MIAIQSRDGRGDTLHEALRAAVEVPETAYLWTPSDAITFKPALSDTIYGDGRALLALTTIHSRPRYYVLRIDSAWEVGLDMDAPAGAFEIMEAIDEIAFDLEAEFGDGRPPENGEQSLVRGRWRWRDYSTGRFLEERQAWPAFDDRDGCSWSRMKWPALPSVEFVPHPYSRLCNLVLP